MRHWLFCIDGQVPAQHHLHTDGRALGSTGQPAPSPTPSSCCLFPSLLLLLLFHSSFSCLFPSLLLLLLFPSSSCLFPSLLLLLLFPPSFSCRFPLLLLLLLFPSSWRADLSWLMLSLITRGRLFNCCFLNRRSQARWWRSNLWKNVRLIKADLSCSSTLSGPLIPVDVAWIGVPEHAGDLVTCKRM